MRMPDKAVVLAAGLTTRLRPLSDTLPKPLLPLWNVPMLFRCLDRLRSWGVREVLVNLHHGAGRIAEALLARPRDGLAVSFSHEPAILGTGGALIRGRWFLGDRPFWMINADVVAELDPQPLVAAFRRDQPLAAWWVDPVRGPRTVGVSGGWVDSFSVARPGAPGTVTFTGLHLISPRLRDWLPEQERFCSILDFYRAAMSAGERIRAVEVPGAFWADVGTPEQYLAAHAEHARGPGAAEARRAAARLRRRGVCVRGFACAPEGVGLAPGVVMADSVVLHGATAAPGADLRNAVVAPGVRAEGRVEHLVVPAFQALGPGELRWLERRGWKLGGGSVELLPPRGSARSYLRLHTDGDSAILVRYKDERPENALFARQARFLHRLGVPVPGILGEDRKAGLVLQEDGGSLDLLGLVDESPTEVYGVYRQVLEAVVRLHERGLVAARRARLPLMPGFDAGLYRWEHELFREHLVGKACLRGAPAWDAVQAELDEVARVLLDEPPVLVHRDLQSSNVLVRGEGVMLIDFQGMRAGAAAYDLASLLYDPYMSLDSGVQNQLLAEYMRLRGLGEKFRRVFPQAAVQRLVQALGAYGRLSALPGCARFAAYVPPALALLRRALSAAGGYAELDRLARSLTAAWPHGILDGQPT